MSTKKGRLVTSHGVAVVGTLETIPGCARITDGSARRDASGRIAFDYAGDTEVWWDNQITETDAMSNERLFVDENGDTLPESEVTIVFDEDEDEDEEPTP